jgi:hypothetical protein
MRAEKTNQLFARSRGRLNTKEVWNNYLDKAAHDQGSDNQCNHFGEGKYPLGQEEAKQTINNVATHINLQKEKSE